jgi:ankyrin repeat protein
MEDLQKAAQADKIDTLYMLITTNPRILEGIDDIPFVDTPLHVATKCGSTHFAIEMLRLKPSFGQKLNQDGLSPLDLALHNGCVETVRRLIEIDGQLVRVKGKESLTLLHHVVKTEQVELLAQILIRCPTSINDLTIRNENALHIAAENGNSEALYVLIGWLQRTDNRHVLRCKDENGNTLLHIVASNYEKYTIHNLPKVNLDY